MKTSNKILFSGLGLIVLSTMSILIFVRANLIPKESLKPFGEIIVQERAVESFTEVLVSGPIHLELSKSSEGLRIEGDKAFVEKMTISQSGERLSIRFPQITNEEKNIINVTLAYDQLSLINTNKRAFVFSKDLIEAEKLELEIDGASNADFNLNTSFLNVGVNGASGTILKGETEKMVSRLSGAAHLNANDLEAKDVMVSTSGASNAKVNAVTKIMLSASGASNIEHSGTAEVTRESRSGAAGIRKKN